MDRLVADFFLAIYVYEGGIGGELGKAVWVICGLEVSHQLGK